MSILPFLSRGWPLVGLTVGLYASARLGDCGGAVCAGTWLGRAGRLKLETPSIWAGGLDVAFAAAPAAALALALLELPPALGGRPGGGA